MAFVLILALLFISAQGSPLGNTKSEVECNRVDTKAAEECHPPLHPTADNYIVGYGSLLQEKSKKLTDPTAGPSIPVVVFGYKRKWNTRGYRRNKLTNFNYETTFLGISEDTNSTWFNGVIFKVKDIAGYDEREKFYCREEVPRSQLTFLTKTEVSENSKYWIYVTKPEWDSKPSREFPIVLAYVDLFLSGCLEIQNEFELKSFGGCCVESTSGWVGEHEWVNNREDTGGVDKLLEDTMPKYETLVLKDVTVV